MFTRFTRFRVAYTTAHLLASVSCLAAAVSTSDDAAASLPGSLNTSVHRMNYTRYVEAQRRKTDGIALAGQTAQWVVQDTIQFIAKHVAQHCH